MKPIDEQIVLVTGSTDGIGKITAEKLADRGATVLVHGRDPEKCDATVGQLRKSSGNDRLVSYTADFSALKEVRSLADAVASDHDRLDVLINNAGVGPEDARGSERRLSRDGYELCFAVNFLAPFLLTRRLVPLLKNAASSRIVNVSSVAQEKIDFEDPMMEKDYEPWRAYARSKLALTLFTFDLADRLNAEGITVNCLHPGTLLDTNMVRESSASPRGRPESGAEVELYAAESPELAGRTGIYLNEKREARAHEQAYDPGARTRLWQLAEKLTGGG